MPSTFTDSRRDLRERAFQSLFSLEFSGDLPTETSFAYGYDKEASDQDELDTPLFLLTLTQGVLDHKNELDKTIEANLKTGWSLERLTITDKTLLRLGLYEISYYEETPDRVALNEIIEIAKKYSDDKSSKFINGLLSQFVKEEPKE